MRGRCSHVACIAFYVSFVSHVLCLHVQFSAAGSHSIKGEFQGTSHYSFSSTIRKTDVWKNSPSSVEPKAKSSHLRKLMQSQSSERDVIAQLYNAAEALWIIDNSTLLTLDGNIQSLINCTTENDVIMFKIQDILKPQSTLIVPWPLTLSGYHEDTLVRHGKVAKVNDKVRFTCPMNGPLIVARTPSFVVANVMIIGCNTTSDIVLLVGNCTKIQRPGQAHLVHVDFSNNIVFNHGSLLNTLGALCTQLSLEDVEFRHNICDGKGCVVLYSNSTLWNISVLQNRKNDTSSDDCSMFSVQEGSHVDVKNMSVVSNETRVFHVNRSSVAIRVSSFRGNNVERLSILLSGTSKGGILFARRSDVSIQDSIFANNFASIGGAVYATSSEMSIENCSFHKNNAIDDRGGAIFANSETACNLMSTNFTDNSANEGGAIYTIEVTLTLEDCKFIRNNAFFGGACVFKDGTSVFAERVTLYANQAISDWGGAVAIITRTEITINDSIFHDNKARGNGGVIDASEDCQVHLTNVTSTNNIAGGRGGSIYFHSRTKVVIVNSNFIGNRAKVGGVMYAESNSNLSVSKSFLTENRAEGSGCIFIELKSCMTIADTILQNNVAKQKGGAISLHSNSTILVYNVSILSNEAGTDCGGICVSDHSFLNATMILVELNSANDTAGGIGVFSNSSFLCYSCLFEMNIALNGAGIYMHSSKEMQSIDAQLQDCLFVNNTANLSGGGLVFEGPHDKHHNCSGDGKICGGIVMLNTSFVDNFATQLGSAILATNVEDVLVACHYNKGRHYDFLDDDYLAFLTHMLPKRLCISWTGNHLATYRMDGVVGTFGKELALSISSTNSLGGVRLLKNEAKGIVLENVRSGKRLPKIGFVVLDAFGNGPAPTIPLLLSIIITSPNDFFQGELRVQTTVGRGTFPSIVGFKSPGRYTIEIDPQAPAIAKTSLELYVPNCFIGEEPTIDNDLCQACDDFSYNFNVTKPGGCTPCPNGSTCKGHYIVPEDGHWHKGPCHNKIAECITKSACKYKSRHNQLVSFTRNFTDCNMNTTIVETYGDLQCNKGYKGCLCGSCDKSYGLSRSLECLKCELAHFSLLRLLGIILYLLIGTSLTIKGTLAIGSRRLIRQDAMKSFHEDTSCASIEEGRDSENEEITHVGKGASKNVTLIYRFIPQTTHFELEHGIETTQGNLVETWKVCSCVFPQTISGF